MKSVFERSILVIRIAKFGPLMEPIRMLLFTMDQFSYIIESFRLEYRYEIEYEYNIRISNQSSFQSRRFSLLLISRSKGFRNSVGVL